MKFKLLFNLIIIFSFAHFAFAQTHYEEIIRDKSGNIQTIITYDKNDIKDGETLHYHPNGVLKKIIPYQNGKINGHVYHYYKNSFLESHGLIINDLQEGIFNYYHNNGRIKANMKFINGKPNQISECQNKKGKVLDCGTFTDGNGYINLYDEKGNLFGKDYFQNGELIRREMI